MRWSQVSTLLIQGSKACRGFKVFALSPECIHSQGPLLIALTVGMYVMHTWMHWV